MSSVDQNQPNSMSSIPTYDTSSFTSLISSHEQKVIVREGFPYYDGSNSTPTKKKIFVSDGEKTGSVKWMSSKMRLMRKLRNIDQVNISKMRSNMHVPQNQGEINGSSSSNNGTSRDNLIRVCSACNTTKTPLWRGGPQGPKSLCNACGIRQRKARKAMAEAERKTQITISSNKIGSDDGRSKRVVPYKKRCKFFSSEDHEELQFEDLSINLNRSSDVREAAILLMALSSDIICG